MTIRAIFSFFPGILACSAVCGQSADKRPRFEVASIKRCAEREGTLGGTSSLGRLTVICMQPVNIVRRAYILFENGNRNRPSKIPITGAPAWAESDLYTIEAKAEGTPNFGAMQGPMMQALLEDRFKLKVHREIREIPVYALTVPPGGAKLPPAKQACIVMDADHPPPPVPKGQPRPPVCGMGFPLSDKGFDVPGGTMADVCFALSVLLDRPVIDRTGLSGAFDVHLGNSPVDLGFPATQRDPDGPTPRRDPADILAGFQSAVKKVGLKLESTKGPGEFLVIDHIERPSSN